MAVLEVSKESIYLRNLIVQLTGVVNCISLLNDNKNAIKLSLNTMYHKINTHTFYS